MATLIQQVKGFVTQQGNAGARGLALYQACVNHMFEHKDWTPLAWLLAKSDDNDARIFRAITGAVTGGISVKKDAKQPSGLAIKMGHNAGTTEKFAILQALVAEGVSFRSKRVLSEIVGKKETEFDAQKYWDRVVKKLADEGLTVADMLKLAARETLDQAA